MTIARMIDLVSSIISSSFLLLLLGGTSIHAAAEENTVYLQMDVPEYETGIYKATYGVRYGCYSDTDEKSVTGAQCVAKCKKDPTNCKRAQFVWTIGECCLSGEHDLRIVAQSDDTTTQQRQTAPPHHQTGNKFLDKFSIVIFDINEAVVPAETENTNPVFGGGSGEQQEYYYDENGDYRPKPEQLPPPTPPPPIDTSTPPSLKYDTIVIDEAGSPATISLSYQMPVTGGGGGSGSGNGDDTAVILGPGLTGAECNRKCKKGKYGPCTAVNYDWVTGRCHLVSPETYAHAWLEANYRMVFIQPATTGVIHSGDQDQVTTNKPTAEPETEVVNSDNQDQSTTNQPSDQGEVSTGEPATEVVHRDDQDQSTTTDQAEASMVVDEPVE